MSVLKLKAKETTEGGIGAGSELHSCFSPSPHCTDFRSGSRKNRQTPVSEWAPKPSDQNQWGCDYLRVMTRLQLSPSDSLGQTSFLPEYTQLRGIRSREHAHATQTFCYLQQKIACYAPVPAHSRCQKLCLLLVPTGILVTIHLGKITIGSRWDLRTLDFG